MTGAAASISVRPGARSTRIAILGTNGLPARYGGFETLAEQLVRYHARQNRPEDLTVYCSASQSVNRPDHFETARLEYSSLSANGIASIAYDATTLRHALNQGIDVALMLGVSGAIALPWLRRKGARIIVHLDGMEWQREKWSPMARRFLKWSEALATRHADAIIADSEAIAQNVRDTHGLDPEVITYGGDQATTEQDPQVDLSPLPDNYALALCRIEPENNVEMILEACAQANQPLVFVGNWNSSAYGKELRQRFAGKPGIDLRDPVYDPGNLYNLRVGSSLYLHGHSAGGTNPSLVEMMHIGRPIFAFDCPFNRETTGNAAAFFDTAESLIKRLQAAPEPGMGKALLERAQSQYTWDKIGAAYFDLFARLTTPQTQSTGG